MFASEYGGLAVTQHDRLSAWLFGWHQWFGCLLLGWCGDCLAVACDAYQQLELGSGQLAAWCHAWVVCINARIMTVVTLDWTGTNEAGCRTTAVPGESSCCCWETSVQHKLCERMACTVSSAASFHCLPLHGMAAPLYQQRLNTGMRRVTVSGNAQEAVEPDPQLCWRTSHRGGSHPLTSHVDNQPAARMVACRGKTRCNNTGGQMTAMTMCECVVCCMPQVMGPDPWGIPQMM